MLLHCAVPEAIEEYSYFVFNAGESNKCYENVFKKYVKGLEMLSMSDWCLISETRKRESEFIIL